MMKCLNCGFIFRVPKIDYERAPLNPGVLYAIAREALYRPKMVCPRCGSDAIVKYKEAEER